MTNYPLGDYLIRIKNAALARDRQVVVTKSKFVESVAQKLKKLGFLEEVTIENGNINSRLAFRRKEPTLIDLKLVSKPGLRKYMSSDEISSRKRRDASILLLSSPVGIVSSDEALKKNVGGEVLVEIW
jgi:small subunit ribosomal protein S8